jgi:hypothetical protein
MTVAAAHCGLLSAGLAVSELDRRGRFRRSPTDQRIDRPLIPAARLPSSALIPALGRLIPAVSHGSRARQGLLVW